MSKKLWGGRFGKKTNPIVEEFTKSIQYDYKLALYDMVGSKIHVQVLKRAGVLKNSEAKKLTNAIQAMIAQAKKGQYKVDPKSEDIHTDIQNKLQKKVGDLALKLQTARSRNEQVVVATKLYLKSQLNKLLSETVDLRNAIIDAAKKNEAIIVPGFTHLQHAQPVLLGDYLGAHYEMVAWDLFKLFFLSTNIKITLGAGALAGTPIDEGKYRFKPSEVLKDLGIKIEKSKKYEDASDAIDGIEATRNSLDSVSNRDFVIDVLSALAITGMHLSRLAEDLIIWSTKEFGFVEIDDAFCTGSSLMPQKKNPDVLELVRGYAGRLYGNLVNVLVMMKGLPLTYNRDMQLDKEPLFDSIEIVSKELKVMAGLIKTLKFNREKIAGELKDESLYATDLVYCLVGKGVAFKIAHDIIGRLVKHSVDNDIKIKDMTQGELDRFSDKLVKKDIIKLFDPKVSVRSKKSVRRQ